MKTLESSTEVACCWGYYSTSPPKMCWSCFCSLEDVEEEGPGREGLQCSVQGWQVGPRRHAPLPVLGCQWELVKVRKDLLREIAPMLLEVSELLGLEAVLES